jgi:hypothetical protein
MPTFRMVYPGDLAQEFVSTGLGIFLRIEPAELPAGAVFLHDLVEQHRNDLHRREAMQRARERVEAVMALNPPRVERGQFEIICAAA